MSDAPVSSAPAADSSAPSSAPETKGSGAPPASLGKQAAQSGVPTPESVTGGRVKQDEKEAPAPSSTEGKAGEKAAAAVQKEVERKMKLKVNGQEREYSESEVLRRAQLAESAQERYKQAAEKERQMEQFIEALRSDPISVLSHPELGVDFRQVAEQFLGEQVRREMMDPVERELADLRAFKEAQENAARESETKTLTERQKAEQARMQQQTIEYYDRKITEVLSASQLPKTPHTVKRVAEVLKNAVENGYDLDIETAVDLVNEDYSTDVSAMLGALDGSQLIKTLGPQNIKKIMDHEINRLKGLRDKKPMAGQAPTQMQSPARTSSRETQQPQMKHAEWLESIRKKAFEK